MKILAFIPARDKSKGIKNKNMVLLNKKPLIYYTLNILKKIKSEVFPFISTDSKKIKKYCEKFGFINEYLRPKHLSRDNSNVLGAINHALKWLKIEKNLSFDAVLLLQPTSPIRDIKEVRRAIYKFKKEKLKSLISVVKMKEHPYDCIKFSNNRLRFLVKNIKKNPNRQNYEKSFFFIDGSFYLTSLDFLKKNKWFFNEKETKIFVQKIKWPIDVDKTEDLLITDVILKEKKIGKILSR